MAPDALARKIAHISEKAKFDALAVALHDYESGRVFSLESAKWFHAASTIKVAVLLAVYKLAELGRIHLGDTLHVRNRFRSVASHEIYRVAINRDGDPSLHQHLGRSMRVRELARSMITRSSNLATNLLLDYLGVATAQQVLNEAKITGVALRRGVEDTAAFAAGLNNEVTADGLRQLFQILHETGFLREATRCEMLEILQAQEFNNMIPAGLPKEARVAHKTGEISTVCHDAGLIFLPGRKPYVLALLAQMPAEVEGRQAALAAVSRAIFEFLTILAPHG